MHVNLKGWFADKAVQMAVWTVRYDWVPSHAKVADEATPIHSDENPCILFVQNSAALFVNLLVDSYNGGFECNLFGVFISNFGGEEKLAVYLVAEFYRESQDRRGFRFETFETFLFCFFDLIVLLVLLLRTILL